MPADFCLVCNKIMHENPNTFLMKTGSEYLRLELPKYVLDEFREAVGSRK